MTRIDCYIVQETCRIIRVVQTEFVEMQSPVFYRSIFRYRIRIGRVFISILHALRLIAYMRHAYMRTLIAYMRPISYMRPLC